MVGPKFLVRTYLMFKLLSRMPGRDINIITKSPPEQFCNSEIKVKELGEEIKLLYDDENAIIVFDDIDNLGSSNTRVKDQFFIRGRHNSLDFYYILQPFFGLSKRTIRYKGNKVILMNQTLEDIENIYRDVGCYDMSYDEYKEVCRKAWEEDYKYLYIVRSKKRDQRTYCICNASKKSIYRWYSDERFLNFIKAVCN